MSEKEIDILNKFIEIYTAMGDEGRARAFMQARRRLMTGAQLAPGRIKTIIDKFRSTGRSKELEDLLADEEVQSYMELTQVMGIGPAAVKKFRAAGITTLAELRRAFVRGEVELTNIQKLGIAHFGDLAKRIPRDEVTKIYQDIMNIIKEAAPDITSIVLGSYRRGAASSGDVDILLSGGKYTSSGPVPRIRRALDESPYTVAILSQGTQKIAMLWSSSSGLVRHIDIFYAKKRQYIPYLLYGTGSAEHNEIMRGMAKARGYKLNQLGLFRADGTQKILHSEEELYNILGVPYVEPAAR